MVAATRGTPATASCQWAGRRRGKPRREADRGDWDPGGGGGGAASTNRHAPPGRGSKVSGNRWRRRLHQPLCTVRAAQLERVRPGATSRRPEDGAPRGGRPPVQRATPRCDGRSVWRSRRGGGPRAAAVGGCGVLNCGASDGGARTY